MSLVDLNPHQNLVLSDFFYPNHFSGDVVVVMVLVCISRFLI